MERGRGARARPPSMARSIGSRCRGGYSSSVKYHLEFLGDFDDFGDFGGGCGDFGGDFGDVDGSISTMSTCVVRGLGWVRRGPERRRVGWWRRAVRQATRRRTAPGPRAPHRPRRTRMLSRTGRGLYPGCIEVHSVLCMPRATVHVCVAQARPHSMCVPCYILYESNLAWPVMRCRATGRADERNCGCCVSAPVRSSVAPEPQRKLAVRT